MANKGLIQHLDVDIEHKALTLLACVAQESKVAMERLIQSTGVPLSLLQLNILHALDMSPVGQLTVNQLKSVLLDETPNVSRTLNKLVDLGLVTKVRSSEDQRVVFVSITATGKTAHNDADQALLTYESPLNKQESQQLLDLLSKF